MNFITHSTLKVKQLSTFPAAINHFDERCVSYLERCTPYSYHVHFLIERREMTKVFGADVTLFSTMNLDVITVLCTDMCSTQCMLSLLPCQRLIIVSFFVVNYVGFFVW